MGRLDSLPLDESVVFETLFNLTNGTDLEWPTPNEFTVSDYIEVAYNLTAMLIGVPINLWALHGHIGALRSRPAHARLIWLGIHLTIGNLMILMIHSAGTIIWLLTYYWYAGDFMCRLFKCLSVMSFHLSSNVVVSIALDMFSSLHSPLRNQVRDGRRRVRYLLSGSWILASFSAMPQLILWGEVRQSDDPDRSTAICHFLYEDYVTFTRMYNFVHLLCVFYVPLVFILFCYVGSGYHVWRHLRSQAHLHEDNRYFATGRTRNHYLSFRKRSSASNIVRQTRTKIRLLRKSGCVIFSYVVCWLPYQIFSVWQSFCDQECELAHYEIINTKLRWLEALMISCACINPFLYTFVRHRPRSLVGDSPGHGSIDISRRESQRATHTYNFSNFATTSLTNGAVRV